MEASNIDIKEEKILLLCDPTSWERITKVPYFPFGPQHPYLAYRLIDNTSPKTLLGRLKDIGTDIKVRSAIFLIDNSSRCPFTDGDYNYPIRDAIEYLNQVSLYGDLKYPYRFKIGMLFIGSKESTSLKSFETCVSSKYIDGLNANNGSMKWDDLSYTQLEYVTKGVLENNTFNWNAIKDDISTKIFKYKPVLYHDQMEKIQTEKINYNHDKSNGNSGQSVLNLVLVVLLVIITFLYTNQIQYKNHKQFQIHSNYTNESLLKCQRDIHCIFERLDKLGLSEKIQEQVDLQNADIKHQKQEIDKLSQLQSKQIEKIDGLIELLKQQTNDIGNLKQKLEKKIDDQNKEIDDLKKKLDSSANLPNNQDSGYFSLFYLEQKAYDLVKKWK